MSVKFNKILSLSLAIAVASVTAQAAPVHHPSGANLTYGEVTHAQTIFSAGGNPAAPAAQNARAENDYSVQTGMSFSAGVEYGNVQELFEVIDDLSRAFKPSPPSSGGGSPTPSPEKPPIDINIEDILTPDEIEIVSRIGTEIATLAGVLGLVANEAYGKAYAGVDIPLVVGKEWLGGAWNVNFNWSATSRVAGIAQEINFNSDQALLGVADALTLLETDPVTEFDLSGGVLLSIDPATGKLGIQLENDSFLLTKAAKTTELSLGYSRQALDNEHGQFFLGAEVKYYNVQLSRVSVRLGDITDSKELFDTIRDSKFNSDNNAGIDIGTLWVGKSYQLGASAINLNEPSFTFPQGKIDQFLTSEALAYLANDREYTMERQLKVEASIFSANQKWSFNLGYDGNSIVDAMGDEFQWATLSAGYVTDQWWLPGVRLGYRENLAGTEVSYVSAGITFLKYLNLDIASALDTVEIEGDKLPRGLMFSLGFHFNI